MDVVETVAWLMLIEKVVKFVIAGVMVSGITYLLWVTRNDR